MTTRQKYQYLCPECGNYWSSLNDYDEEDWVCPTCYNDFKDDNDDDPETGYDY